MAVTQLDWLVATWSTRIHEVEAACDGDAVGDAQFGGEGWRVAGRGSRNDAMIGDCRQSGLAGQGDGQYSVRSVNSLQAGAEAG